MTQHLSPHEFLAFGKQLRFDLMGFAPLEALERSLPQDYRPSRLSRQMVSIVVVARRRPGGVTAAHHASTKQFWGGRILKRIDESCARLAGWAEQRGAAAFPLSSMAVDMGAGKGLDLCPAGQGSPLLRQAAVAAGLGTLGLNEMLLTPQFGPRIILGGVLLDIILPYGTPLHEELCPGLEECGLCAATCPEDAIPRRARRGAALAEYRGLDAAACARSSQPLGPRVFREHLQQILDVRGDRDQVWPLVRSRLTGALWQEMIMIKEGAFTGCSACVNICPVGEDYARIGSRLEEERPDVTRIFSSGHAEVQPFPDRKPQ